MMRNMLLAMDPPRHVDYRRPLVPTLQGAGDRADGGPDPRRSAARSWTTAAEQGDVEFVHDVTSTLPSRVIGQLMGLPDEDWPLIHRLAEMQHERPGLRLRGATPTTAARSTWRCTRSSSRPSAAREPPQEDLTTLHPRDRLQRHAT